MPNQLAVLVNRFDPVQGNGMRLALVIEQFENAGAVLWKPDFAKRHEDDFVLDPVVITDDEFAAAEFRVPADAMEEVLNGDHNRFKKVREITLTSYSLSLRAREWNASGPRDRAVRKCRGPPLETGFRETAQG